MVWLGRLACVPLVLGAVLAPVAGGSSGATPVNGMLTLAAFNPNTACKFSNYTLTKPAGPMKAGQRTLLAQCSVTGKYSGSPHATAASYGWNWYLAVGSNGKTTGLAAEYGALSLTTAAGPLLLLTTGLQKPVGAQTSAHAKGMSTGTWLVRGAGGKGTYSFTTERKGSTFTTAVIRVKGS